MDGLLDRASPRRGSLTSLHKQTSGSFSHNPKCASPSSTLQANNTNLYGLYKDLDKFTRYFVIKAVQVIVQSRLNGNKQSKTECKPTGNDWFNINIPDITEVVERTKAKLDADGLSIKSNWRFCCEISLQTSDGGRIALEHWIISNRTNFNSNQRLNVGQTSPKGYLSNRSSTSHLASPNATNSTPLSAINSSTSSRSRPATFSSSRTRLNSIDDGVGDSNLVANRLLMGINNENLDINSSASCFSLSNTANPNTDINNLTAGSSSTNSLNGNVHSNNDHPNGTSTTAPQNSNKSSTTSSIYTIYNKMSLLLKTLLTTTHIVPASRLINKIHQTESCTVCYRIHVNLSPHPNMMTRGSIEDVNHSANSESPNRRSNLSLGSVNIREFVGPDEIDNYHPVLKLGTVKTEINELEVSVCYRSDMRNSGHPLRSPKLREMTARVMDEDCILAAKQLLAGNERMPYGHSARASEKGSNGHLNLEQSGLENLNWLDKPLTPAFAKTELSKVDTETNPDLIESAFDVLWKNTCPTGEDTSINPEVTEQRTAIGSNGCNRSSNAQSEPIQVPSVSQRPKYRDHHANLSAGSTPKSLTDSFVFVDLNPPFASEEQNDINSFFHGPSPSFSNGFDCVKDVDELANQLAVIEANAGQIDEFVENICASENDEEAGSGSE